MPSMLTYGATNFTGWMYQVIFASSATALVCAPFWLAAVGLPRSATLVGDAYVASFVCVLLRGLVRILWVVASLRRRGLNHSRNDPSQPPPFHVVAIAMCNEPDDIVVATLKSIDRQPNAGRICVVIGMEEKTSRKTERADLYAASVSRVRSIHTVTHPRGVPGEVPGHGSNESWALRHFVRSVLPERREHPAEYCYTGCDCDTIFVDGHFELLDERFSAYLQSRRPVLWQGFPAYLWFRDSASSLANAKSLFLTEWWIGVASATGCHGLSCISLPLEVVVAAGYKHPGYVADDAMIAIQSSIAYSCPIAVELLPIPFYNTPPLGATWVTSLRELAKQEIRWHGGMLENIGFYWAHYRCGCQLLSWTFKMLYYRVIVPMTGVLFISASLGEIIWGPIQFGASGSILQDIHSVAVPLRLVAGGLAVPLMNLLIVLLDQYLPNKPPGHRVSRVGIFARFASSIFYMFLFSPPVFAWSFLRVLVLGRAGIVHTPASKSARAADAGGDAPAAPAPADAPVADNVAAGALPRVL